MNINEIAKMAGVSRATVSRYFNDGYVSEEKKEKIREVVEKTGYQPSKQAQMLRNKKTKLVGVIIPKINSESISRIVAGISEIFSQTEYQIIMANTFNDEKEEVKYLKIFKENEVDGIILIGTIFTPAHKKALKELKVPIVILGQEVKGHMCVYNDDYHAAKEVSYRMIEKLKQRHPDGKIAYIGVTQKDEAAGKARREGFFDALDQCERDHEQVIEKETGFAFRNGYDAMKALMEEEENIHAVFCATDTLAIGAMSYAKERGKKIPEDMMFAGIGDSTIGHGISPRLTTVHLFYKTGGREAANILLQMMKSKGQVERQIRMSYKVIENDTI